METEKLVKMLGTVGQCRGCRAVVYWVKTKTGKNMPLDPDGEPHFATCPDAARFRKKL